ncbi:serine hydrolase domain-containing protein [Massilia psychrophila]|uniref:Serine hydrolase n=1 Tax=Massilia psychrophila TaxID=1603353 RepID=A0A2G8SWS8_9BURK|nr:serine hydrolase [Massilia psychrophila]PIL38192.1 serine hydrolase [Massilia psychrophila]
MKQRRRTLLGLALLGATSQLLLRAAPAAGGDSVLDAELAAIAADPACQLASLSVLAIRHGKLRYEQQFGQRRAGTGAGSGLPANVHTLYRIASISKMMTTLGLMMLVEQAKLALDADAGNYLGFALRNPHFPERAITLRHLLTHTSSLRDEAGYSWPCDTALSTILVPGAARYGKGQMWAEMGTNSAGAGPGDYFTYCNLNWGVIGTIMERVTGERFDRLMKRLLLTPMGLHGGYNPSELTNADLANVATLYRKRAVDTEVWDAAGAWIAQADDYSERAPRPPAGIASYVAGTNATPFSPTGGLRISAHDMGQVMLMLMNEGVHQGRRLLKPATIAAMFTPQWTHDGSGGKDGNGDTHHGLFNCWALGNQQFPDRAGMQLVEGGGFCAAGHLGEAYGLRSLFVFDAAARNGMVVLVGGTSADPETRRGAYSPLARFEERTLTALYRRTIQSKGQSKGEGQIG